MGWRTKWQSLPLICSCRLECKFGMEFKRRNGALMDRKNLDKCFCRSSHLWSGSPGQGKSKTLARARMTKRLASDSRFRSPMDEYRSVNSLSFQMDGGRTVPVRVTRKWAAEWTRAGESRCRMTGPMVRTIAEVKSLHKVSWWVSEEAMAWSWANQWHQAFKDAMVETWLNW